MKQRNEENTSHRRALVLLLVLVALLTAVLLGLLFGRRSGDLVGADAIYVCREGGVL